MAALYLVRHGQASFGKADYDQLSEKGIEQATILGTFWPKLAMPTQFYSGDLLRHEQTTNAFVNGLNQGNFPLITHSGLNEFNHVDILKCYRPDWENFNALNAYLATSGNPKLSLHFEFFEAMKRWMSSEYDSEYQETWSQFKLRCVNTLKEIITQELAKVRGNDNSSKTKNIVVFTSGGPISIIVQHILGLNDSQGLMMNQQLRNTSVTKLLFSNDLISLDYFNNFSHLESKGSNWITYR